MTSIVFYLSIACNIILSNKHITCNIDNITVNCSKVIKKNKTDTPGSRIKLAGAALEELIRGRGVK